MYLYYNGDWLKVPIFFVQTTFINQAFQVPSVCKYADLSADYWQLFNNLSRNNHTNVIKLTAIYTENV